MPGKMESNLMTKSLFILIRPHHWIKNLLVFMPLVFSGAFTDQNQVLKAGLIFLVFCCAASSVYILNDLMDRVSDQKHPQKLKYKPLANGSVSVRAAVILLVGLYLLIAAALWVYPTAVAIAVIYILLNLGYSFGLKNLPLLEIFIVASGYVLRIVAGVLMNGLAFSSWMFITTLALALFMTTLKRSHELRGMGAQARGVLAHYTQHTLDQFAVMTATCTMVFYSLFVVASRPDLVLTVPIVLFGVMRYYQAVEQMKSGEQPVESVLGDLQLLTAALVWVTICGWQTVSAGITPP